MHFEILVEGTSDKTALWTLLKKILGERGNPHTWNVRKHRGIGKIPDHPEDKPNPKDQTLLHNLPAKLRAYGNEQNQNFVVVVLVDLDERTDCKVFKNELLALLDYCTAKPKCLFRIAVEELEAWYLGDRKALLTAYPKGCNPIPWKEATMNLM